MEFSRRDNKLDVEWWGMCLQETYTNALLSLKRPFFLSMTQKKDISLSNEKKNLASGLRGKPHNLKLSITRPRYQRSCKHASLVYLLWRLLQSMLLPKQRKNTPCVGNGKKPNVSGNLNLLKQNQQGLHVESTAVVVLILRQGFFFCPSHCSEC